MTTEAKHTPTPWMYRQPEAGPLTPLGERENWPFHIDRQGTPGKTDWGVLICKCWGHVTESAEANAKLIVRAVNSHAQLLAACKAAEQLIYSRWGIRTGEGTPSSIVLEQLGAAIAAAETELSPEDNQCKGTE